MTDTSPHQPVPADQLAPSGAPTLADQPARDRIAGDLDATLFVEAGAGSGKTRSLVDRVVALVDAGTDMRNIAAITFTEKAAVELRDRIRQSFERRAADLGTDQPTRQRFRAALDQVDAAAISTLHAFAQRILTEHPIEAELPPNVDVLDEVSSDIEFEDRWNRFRDRLLDAPELERCLLLAFAIGIRLDDLRHLAIVFNDNWDLVGDPDRFPWAAEDPPHCDVARFVERIEALLARRAECTDGDDKLLGHLDGPIADFLASLKNAPDEYQRLGLLAAEYPRFAYTYGRKGNWVDKQAIADELGAIGTDKADHALEIGRAALQRVALELRDFTLDAARERRASGRLEFHDLLVMARDLLRGPHGEGVRAALRSRYQRLLLDEFQDTDPIQIEIATLIASTDPDAAHRSWEDVEVEEGRLFFVGDPKQSIYRFRRADIDLFLKARDTFGELLQLTTNFRTTPPVIDWVNHVFSRLITHEAGSQPEYRPLDAAPARETPPDGQPVVVLGREIHLDRPDADTLREREAADVADAVQTALGWRVSDRQADGTETWRDATLGDITILLPARTSLAALERALETRGLPYRAESSSLVYTTREVRDLLLTARALVDPTDALALVSALRSPVFGCGDDDLFEYRVTHHGAWHVYVDPPDTLPDDHPVVDAMTYLRSLTRELPWLAPSELLDRLARDRRLFELGYADGRPRDLWRRLRFVIDQARVWSETEGGTLREYLDWARLQASESARVAETILPETDDDSVAIMTIHASKGLEFPITIVTGTTSAPRGRTQRVEVAFPPGRPVAMKVGPTLTTRDFENFQPIDEQMSYHERLRLLYVACTRAKDHLVVSLHRKERRSPPKSTYQLTNAELLAEASGDAPHQQDLVATPVTAPTVTTAEVGTDLPPFDVWEAELAATLATSQVRRSVSASDVALLDDRELVAGGAIADAALDAEPAAAPEGEADAGFAKNPRDLELPPWLKGRYGTAIGRAVHAVLQTIDLATGDGLDAAAAAQAAAEGVIGREGDIARLARAALDAPAVQQARRHPRWRETYVATTVGDRTLEGYIDLLYRTDEGLVVVDYKTASANADLDRRMDDYRWQGGAYAVAVEGATGEDVARVVFVFLTAGGPVERELPDLPAAIADVRGRLSRPLATTTSG